MDGSLSVKIGTVWYISCDIYLFYNSTNLHFYNSNCRPINQMHQLNSSVDYQWRSACPMIRWISLSARRCLQGYCITVVSLVWVRGEILKAYTVKHTLSLLNQVTVNWNNNKIRKKLWNLRWPNVMGHSIAMELITDWGMIFFMWVCSNLQSHLCHLAGLILY